MCKLVGWLGVGASLRLCLISTTATARRAGQASVALKARWSRWYGQCGAEGALKTLASRSVDQMVYFVPTPIQVLRTVAYAQPALPPDGALLPACMTCLPAVRGVENTKLAIEVDGPHHFAVNPPFSPLASTDLRNRMLAMDGCVHVCTRTLS